MRMLYTQQKVCNFFSFKKTQYIYMQSSHLTFCQCVVVYLHGETFLLPVCFYVCSLFSDFVLIANNIIVHCVRAE